VAARVDEKPGLVRHQNYRRHVDGVLATSFELAGGVGSDWGFYWPVAGQADSRRCLNAQSILSMLFDMHFYPIKTVWLPSARVRPLEVCGAKFEQSGHRGRLENYLGPVCAVLLRYGCLLIRRRHRYDVPVPAFSAVTQQHPMRWQPQGGNPLPPRSRTFTLRTAADGKDRCVSRQAR